MEQGQEEMRLAQERFEREAKEGGELPLQDSKEDGTVEEGEKARLENAQKVSHKWKEIPCSSPAAITPAKPGSASSAAAQPRTEEPQKERSEKAPARSPGVSESAKKVGGQTPLQSPATPFAQTPQARGSAAPEVMHTPLKSK